MSRLKNYFKPWIFSAINVELMASGDEAKWPGPGNDYVVSYITEMLKYIECIILRTIADFYNYTKS